MKKFSLLFLLLFVGCTMVMHSEMPKDLKGLKKYRDTLTVEIETLEEEVEQAKKNIELASEMGPDTFNSNHNNSARKNYDNKMFFLKSFRTRLVSVKNKIKELEDE